MQHRTSSSTPAPALWPLAALVLLGACGEASVEELSVEESETAGGAGAIAQDAGSGGTGTCRGTQCGSPDSGSGGAQGVGGGTGGTRQPPPGGKWNDATANLTGMDAACGTVSMVAAKPDEDVVLAGIAERGLYASTNGGQSWEKLGTGAGSAEIKHRPYSVTFDPDHPGTYWVPGIWGDGAGLYATTDSGNTFTAIDGVYGAEAVSVHFGDPARQTMLAGTHEAARQAFRTDDGGQSWQNVGANLPADSDASTGPLVIGPQDHLIGCSGFAGDVSGIFRTTDGGQSWTQVSKLGGAKRPLQASDGSIYWASEDGKGMVRSADGGQSFLQVTGAGVLRSLPPVELPDGRVLALGASTVKMTSDGGKTWSDATSAFSFSDPRGLTYSTHQKAIFVWRFDCNSPVKAGSIVRHSFDWETS